MCIYYLQRYKVFMYVCHSCRMCFSSQSKIKSFTATDAKTRDFCTVFVDQIGLVRRNIHCYHLSLASCAVFLEVRLY